MTKAEIRREMLDRRAGVDAAQLAAASRRVWAALRALPEVTRARCVVGYLAFAGEVDVTGFLAECAPAGKSVLLPRFQRTEKRYEMVAVRDPGRDVEPGHYGILEPRAGLPSVAPETLLGRDLVWLVPGVAFDGAGNRLGRGKGYYDRLLTGVEGLRIGVAHDWQVVAAVPSGPHDVRMNLVVSDRRVVRVAGTAADGGAK